MSCPRRNIFTGKPFRKRQPKWKRRADYRRRKRGIYKVSSATRRRMSRAQRRRHLFSQSGCSGVLIILFFLAAVILSLL